MTSASDPRAPSWASIRRAMTFAMAAGLLPTAAPGQAATSAAPWHADRINALEAQLRANPHVRAFLMQRGSSTFAYYRPDTTPTTLVNVASVTKSVVALLVGIAIERGAISGVDEPLSAFFPEHARGPNGQALRRVTLRHLLTMSSGFDRKGFASNSDHPDFQQRFYAPGLLAYALGRELEIEPGRAFYYGNLNSHLVAVALSRRLQVPLAQFARDELFGPLGIERFDWATGEDGIPNGASELRIAMPDLLRIGRMMCDGGRWNGQQVVPQAFVQEATSRKIHSDIPPRGRQELWGYGYLWWTASTPGEDLPAYFASGYGGQYIYVVPALDLVVVATTDQVSRQVGGQTGLIIRDFALPAVTR